MPHPTRRALLAAALAASPLGTAFGQGATQANETLRIVSPWEYTSDDPADTGFLLTRCGIAQTLIGVRPDGSLEGLVAESWAVDPDHLTWRFRIRPGAQFHDGTQVTPQAVAASLRSAFRGESLSNVPLDNITHDDAAVLIRTTTPYAPLPTFLVDYASVILAPSAFGSDGAVQRIVATGPYRWVGPLPGASPRAGFEAERFEGYWGPKPAFARMRHTAVPNGDTRANIAIAGDADLVFTVAPQAIPRINAAGSMKVTSLTIPRLRFITLNLGLKQFDDVRVRQALSLAIDRAGIAAGILRHPGSTATQLLPPVLTAWHDPALPPLRTDPAQARALLDQAGWRPGPDGIRIKDGTRLAATVMVPSNRPELPVVATAIQAQFRAVGMDMSIDVGLPAALPEAVRTGTMQMGFIARTYVNVPDPIATIIPDYTRERSVWGTLNWDGRARMKALTDAYVVSFDEAERAQLRRRITTLLHDEMPVIPVSWYELTVAIGTRLRNVVVDPYETRYYPDRATLG